MAQLEAYIDVQKSDTLDHYNRAASVYNQWLAPYIITTVNCVLNHLPLTPDDIIVDIGGGTGDVAHRVWKQAKLKNPILCVDPSEGMIEIAKERDGIETFHGTAEEFCSSQIATSKPYTKVLICGCAHFFTDREAIFSSLKSRFPNNEGASCMVSYLEFMSPLIPAAAEHFKSGYLQKEVEVDIKVFDKVGLKWKAFDFVETHPLRKTDWYDFHRKRMLRCLRSLSDAEIEEGLQVLEGKYGSQDVLDIEVQLKVIILECS